MKKLLLLLIISMQVNNALATSTSVKTNEPGHKVARTVSWDQIRSDLIRLTQKFQNSSLNEDQKVALLPATNELLSYMQDIHLNEHEKMDQIQVVVQLLAASHEADFASSNADTLYFEYAKFKNYYGRVINQLPNTQVRKELLNTFNELESAAGAVESETEESF